MSTGDGQTTGDKGNPEELNRLKEIVRQQRLELETRASAKRRKQVEFALHVLAQALGTMFGAGLIYVAAVLSGVLKNVALVQLIPIVILTMGPLLSIWTFVWYQRSRPISEEEARLRQLNKEAMLKRYGEKLAAGDDLSPDEVESLYAHYTIGPLKPKKWRGINS